MVLLPCSSPSSPSPPPPPPSSNAPRPSPRPRSSSRRQQQRRQQQRQTQSSRHHHHVGKNGAAVAARMTGPVPRAVVTAALSWFVFLSIPASVEAFHTIQRPAILTPSPSPSPTTKARPFLRLVPTAANTLSSTPLVLSSSSTTTTTTTTTTSLAALPSFVDVETVRVLSDVAASSLGGGTGTGTGPTEQLPTNPGAAAAASVISETSSVILPVVGWFFVGFVVAAVLLITTLTSAVAPFAQDLMKLSAADFVRQLETSYPEKLRQYNDALARIAREGQGGDEDVVKLDGMVDPETILEYALREDTEFATDIVTPLIADQAEDKVIQFVTEQIGIENIDDVEDEEVLKSQIKATFAEQKDAIEDVIRSTLLDDDDIPQTKSKNSKK